MRKFATGLLLIAALLVPAYAQKKGNPLVGHWDFNIPSPGGNRAAWLGITPKKAAPSTCGINPLAATFLR